MKLPLLPQVFPPQKPMSYAGDGNFSRQRKDFVFREKANQWHGGQWLYIGIRRTCVSGNLKDLEVMFFQKATPSALRCSYMCFVDQVLLSRHICLRLLTVCRWDFISRANCDDAQSMA